MSILIKKDHIKQFKLNCNMNLLDDKNFNFIYANNGVGKTIICNYLMENYSQKFIKLKNDDDINFDATSFTFRPNQKELDQIKNNINSLLNEIKEDSIKKLKEANITKSKSNWKNFLSVYLKENNIDLFEQILKGNFNEYNNVDFIDGTKNYLNVLKKFNNFILSNNIEDNSIDFNNLIQLKYNEIIGNYKEIKEQIDKKIKELKFKIKKINPRLRNIGIDKYEEIYNIISDIDNMDECCICDSYIENFQLQKEKMKEIIDNYKNDIQNTINVKCIDYFHNNKIIDKNIFYKDPFEYINLLKENTKKIDDKTKFFLRKLHKECLISEKIQKIENLYNDYIQELEKSKNKLKIIKDNHLEIIKGIIRNIMGDRLEFNFDNVQEFIKIDQCSVTKENLPLSSGEKSLIIFIFNLFIAISEYKEDKFILIDDPKDYFDIANSINMYYLLKLSVDQYNVKFIIFTHDDSIINYFYEVKKDINLQIMYKNRNEIRVLKKVEKTEIKFLSFSSGIREISMILIETINNKKNSNDLFILVFYLVWILRVKEYLYKFKSRNNNLFNFLKGDFFDNDNKSEFEKTIQWINQIFECNINIQYDEFKDWYNNVNVDLKTINFNCKNLNEMQLIKCNIINIVKLILLRENIKKYFGFYEENDNCHEQNIWGQINTFYKDKIIDENQRDTSIYLLNICNGYIHIENKPSLLINGISLDSIYVDKLIDVWRKCIDNGVKNER